VRTVATFALLALGMILAAASQEKPAIKMVPPTNVPASSGPEMFKTYCAVCHGTSGKGDGPAAQALKTAPPDLTQITPRNNGQFPELKVQQSITMDHEVGAHGSREMPVWGPVFRSIESGDSIWRLRVQNLTLYIRSIQTK
jgi:mono/diheme cytochrome c family protein